MADHRESDFIDLVISRTQYGTLYWQSQNSGQLHYIAQRHNPE